MSNILLLVVLALNIVFVNIRIDELQKQVKELKSIVVALERRPHNYPPCVYEEIDPGIYERSEPPKVECIAVTNKLENIGEVFRNPPKGEWKAVKHD